MILPRRVLHRASIRTRRCTLRDRRSPSDHPEVFSTTNPSSLLLAIRHSLTEMQGGVSESYAAGPLPDLRRICAHYTIAHHFQQRSPDSLRTARHRPAVGSYAPRSWVQSGGDGRVRGLRATCNRHHTNKGCKGASVFPSPTPDRAETTNCMICTSSLSPSGISVWSRRRGA